MNVFVQSVKRFVWLGMLVFLLGACSMHGVLKHDVAYKAMELYFEDHDVKAAIALIERQVKEDPNQALNPEKLQQMPAIDHGVLCELYRKNYDFTRTKDCVDRYFKRPDVKMALAQTCSPATFFAVTTDFAETQQCYITGIVNNADFNNIDVALAGLPPLLQLCEQIRKCEIIKYGYERVFRSANGHLAAAHIYAAAGERAKAMYHIKVLEKNATNSLYYEVIAPIYMALGEYREAYDLYTSNASKRRSDYRETGVDLQWTETKNQDGSLSYKLENKTNVFVALNYGNTNDIVEHFITWELQNIFLLAKCEYEIGRGEKAEATYRKLITVPYIQQQFSDIYLEILKDLAHIEIRKENIKEGIDFLKKAIDVLEQRRSTIHTDNGKIGFVGDKQELYRELVALLLQTGRTSEAFEYVERGKARALVDMLAHKKQLGSGQHTKQAQTLLNELYESEIAVVRSASSKGKKQNPVHLRSAISDTKRQLQQAAPEFASLGTVNPLKTSEVQAHLAADETLIEFFAGKDSLTAFIVTGRDIHSVQLDVGDMDKSIAAFRKDILSWNSKNYQANAKDLYQKVFKPLTPYLKTKNLTIVAHGSLHYLPFNALHNGKSFLIDKYSIRMLPSASVMEFLGKTRDKNGSMLVLANPDLGNAQYDLPAAGLEGKAIAKGRSNANVLSRKAATETALKKQGAAASRIHIASHGQFKAEAPLKSRLLLAGDGENDGNLTVDELYNLELNADLVTLSACETGLGDVKNGDDVIGLTRGFLFAGVNSIVSTLWVVDDTATANLMVAFYDGLDKKSTQEALRQAQLKIKKEYNEHPFFWAAFQLTGSM